MLFKQFIPRDLTVIDSNSVRNICGMLSVFFRVLIFSFPPIIDFQLNMGLLTLVVQMKEKNVVQTTRITNVVLEMGFTVATDNTCDFPLFD